MEDLFNKLDLNKDGELSRHEVILGHVIRCPCPREYNAYNSLSFHPLALEVIQGHVILNTTAEGAARLFDKLDVNGDGVLSLDEFVDDGAKKVT